MYSCHPEFLLIRDGRKTPYSFAGRHNCIGLLRTLALKLGNTGMADISLPKQQDVIEE
jgi:hypothetical protein